MGRDIGDAFEILFYKFAFLLECQIFSGWNWCQILVANFSLHGVVIRIRKCMRVLIKRRSVFELFLKCL